MPIVGVLLASRGAGALVAAGAAPDAMTSAAAPRPAPGGDDGDPEVGAADVEIDADAAVAGLGVTAGATAGVLATGDASAGAGSVVRDLSRRAILGSSMSSPAGVAARATVAAANKTRQGPAARTMLDRPVSFQLLGRS